MIMRRRFARVTCAGADNALSSCHAAEALLLAAVAHCIGPHAPPLTGWPTLNWQHDAFVLACTGWRAEANPERRLAQLALTSSPDAWTVTIRLAATAADEILVFEEVQTPTQTTLDHVPDFLSALAGPGCTNADDAVADSVRRVTTGSVPRFSAFVQSPERRLPIVLISPAIAGNFKLHPHACAQALFGMAHVIVLDPQRRWWRNSLPFYHHACFDGCVRIYHPGFAESQSPGAHRYWSRQQIEEDPARAFAALVACVADASARGTWMHAAFGLLGAEQAEERQQARITESAERIRAALAASQEEHIEFAEQLLRESDEAIKTLKEIVEVKERRIQELVDQVQSKEHKIRALLFNLEHEWNVGHEPDEPSDEPQIQLHVSVQAKKVFDEVDAGERERIRKMLCNLMEPDLRNKQCEPIAAGSGLRVYPRGRSAGGRRLIFFEEQADVYLCEIFPNHAAYDEARNRAAIHDARYETFEPFSFEIVIPVP